MYPDSDLLSQYHYNALLQIGYREVATGALTPVGSICTGSLIDKLHGIVSTTTFTICLNPLAMEP